MPAVEDTATTNLSEDLAFLNEELETQVPVIEPKPKEPVEHGSDNVEIVEEDEPKEIEIEAEEEETPEPKQFNEPLPDVPQIAEIKAKYPEIFKDFPSLRGVLFREKEFTEVFPTVEDAKEAAENNESFVNLRENIINGDGTLVLGALKEVDQLNQFAANFLPSLWKMSPDAHWAAVIPLLENAVKGAFREAERTKNEDLRISAENMALFLLGDSKIASTDAKAQRNIQQTVRENNNDRGANTEDPTQKRFQVDTMESGFNSVRGEIKSLLAPVESNKKHPNNFINDWTRDTLEEKIFQEVNNRLQSDTGHMKYMDSLWRKAKTNGWTRSDQSKLISAYLDRAKRLIPSIRSEFMTKVLGNSQRVQKAQRQALNNVRRGTTEPTQRVERENSSNHSNGGGGKNLNRTSEISDRDILDL